MAQPRERHVVGKKARHQAILYITASLLAASVAAPDPAGCLWENQTSPDLPLTDLKADNRYTTTPAGNLNLLRKKRQLSRINGYRAKLDLSPETHNEAGSFKRTFALPSLTFVYLQPRKYMQNKTMKRNLVLDNNNNRASFTQLKTEVVRRNKRPAIDETIMTQYTNPLFYKKLNERSPIVREYMMSIIHYILNHCEKGHQKDPSIPLPEQFNFSKHGQDLEQIDKDTLDFAYIMLKLNCNPPPALNTM